MIAAIGDVHGEKWKLDRLLKRLPPVDRIVLLGDYVDRGPDVRQTLDRLIALKAERSETVFLRGNHDQMAMDARDHFLQVPGCPLTAHDVASWFGWGGTETVRSYGESNKPWPSRVPAAHWEFLESTVLEHVEGAFRFVHAGVVPPEETYLPYAEWQAEPRLWIRDEFLRSRADFGHRIVFGHTVQTRGPLVEPNKIGIDTGACFGGPLTAAILDPEIGEVIDFVQAT